MDIELDKKGDGLIIVIDGGEAAPSIEDRAS
jgi:hypothetical protein